MKKFKYFLQLIDGLWSIPLAFVGLWLIGWFISSVLGLAVGVYDVSTIQALPLAAAVVIGAANIAMGGLYFTFRGLYRYLYGQKEADGKTLNYSKIDWKKINSWQRLLLAFLVFFLLFLAVIVVYLKLA